MILNHKEAIRYLVENIQTLTLSSKAIKTVHFLLASDLISEQDVGKVRSHGVRVSSCAYLPLENPKQIEKQLDVICKKAIRIKNPYEQSFFLLLHLSYLQAFADVNKRCTRLIANIPLLKHNIVPLSFNDIEQDDYIYALMTFYEMGDYLPMAELYKYTYLRTCHAYDATVESMGFDKVKVLYRTQRRGMVRHIVTHKLKKKTLDAYVQEQAQAIPQQHRDLFVEDVHEDLRYLSPERIAGLGITLAELSAWKK